MAPNVATEMTQDPWTRVPGETPREARDRRRQFHALVARFVHGDTLVTNVHVKVLRPTHADFKDMIEFRSGPPDPQTRVFCSAYCPGVWIATGFHYRDDLGDFGDPRWLAAAQASKANWASIFGTKSPLSAPYPCDTKAKLRALTDG